MKPNQGNSTSNFALLRTDCRSLGFDKRFVQRIRSSSVILHWYSA